MQKYRGTWNLKCVSTHECCVQKYSWEWMNTNYQVLLVTGDYLRLVSQAVASYKFPLFERSKPNFSFLSSETLNAKLQQLGGLLFKWQPIRVDGGGGGTVHYKTAPSSNKILTTLITLRKHTHIAQRRHLATKFWQHSDNTEQTHTHKFSWQTLQGTYVQGFFGIRSDACMYCQLGDRDALKKNYGIIWDFQDLG